MSGSQLSWPGKGPDEVLDYSLDMTHALVDPLTQTTDPVTSLTLTVAPSGTGEMTAADLSVAGVMMTVWFSGGRAGRRYVVNIDATTAAGRTFQWQNLLQINVSLITYVLPDPPERGPGTALVWP